jgi:hypothetical protein
MKEITLSPNVIARTLTLAKQMVDDAKYRTGKGSGAGNTRYKFAKGSSYILKIIKHARPDQGLLCRRCDNYIAPNQRCYSKSGNPDLSTHVYYHIECAERLYQE